MATPNPSSRDIELVGVGNAIVDVISNEAEDFIAANGLPKGGMQLIEAEEAVRLYDLMGPGLEMSGGSAANTLAGFASFGGRGAFMGKVAGDQLGEVFAHDMRAIGVHYDTAPLGSGAPTARCLIVVTPDAERTMSTFLGASSQFGPGDLDPEIIKRAGTIYLEGYLFDQDPAKEAFFEASRIAEAHGVKVALSLSDTFCVERHRESFKELVSRHVDILFANEAEIMTLTETSDFEAAASEIRGQCALACLTQGSQGSILVTAERDIRIPAEKVAKVVDTTGAGDLYAAGVLFGLARGKDLSEAGRLGALAAAEVIGHMGARPEMHLSDLAA